MIGLQHGSRKESDVLAGMMALLRNPELCTDKLKALAAATQMHRDAFDAHNRVKIEAEAKTLRADEKIKELGLIEKSIKAQQAELAALYTKIAADTKQLEIERLEHEKVRAGHEQALIEHREQLYALNVRKTQLDARQSDLAEREAAVSKAEKDFADRIRRLRESLG